MSRALEACSTIYSFSTFMKWMSKEERKEGKGKVKIFEELIVNTFSKLRKSINLQVQGSPQSPIWTNTKK
jgi:hypothetical protein